MLVGYPMIISKKVIRFISSKFIFYLLCLVSLLFLPHTSTIAKSIHDSLEPRVPLAESNIIDAFIMTSLIDESIMQEEYFNTNSFDHLLQDAPTGAGKRQIETLFSIRKPSQSIEVAYSDLGQPDSFVEMDFDSDVSIELMEESWFNFKKGAKQTKYKLESAMNVRFSEINDMFSSGYQLVDSASKRRGSGISEGQQQSDQLRNIPTYYKIVYTFINIPSLYPITFYSSLFLFLFFVFIKSILIITPYLR